MKPDEPVRVRKHRRITQRGKIIFIPAHLRPRPHPRR